MITLDYKLSGSSKSQAAQAELPSADETALRYYVLLGDVIIKVNGHDFSANWGWIPIVDFTVSLVQIAAEVASREGMESIFEFTESDATLHFKRSGDTVSIRASYLDGEAQVLFDELKSAIGHFASRVARELVEQYPSLRQNQAFAKLLPISAA